MQAESLTVGGTDLTPIQVGPGNGDKSPLLRKYLKIMETLLIAVTLHKPGGSSRIRRQQLEADKNMAMHVTMIEHSERSVVECDKKS